MRILPPFLRMLATALLLTVLASACAAEPTITVTRELTPAELAAQAEADRAFAATPAYLARVKARATQLDSVRFEIFTSVESSFITVGSRSTPFIVGEQIGNKSRIAMDMGNMFGPLVSQAGVSRNALSMTLVSEGDVSYLNTPLFAEVMRVTDISTADYPWAVDIAAGWGRIDSGASGSRLMANMGMNGGAGAEEMLALLDSAGEVLDGGAGEVRGVPVRIAHAQVSIAEVLEQSGQSLKSMGIEGSDADALRQLAANIAVHVGDEGQVMRLEYNMDLSSFEDLDPSLVGLNLRMWQRVDFFDHGGAVDIAVPLTWIDITDDFEDLLKEFN